MEWQPTVLFIYSYNLLYKCQITLIISLWKTVVHSFLFSVDLNSYPQSGAGHHLQSGSATSHLLSMNSSYFSISVLSPRIRRMSWGLNLSAHSGQLMLTRDSEISMRRYWRRQSMQERWWQVMISGKLSREWCRRHRGHSSSSEPVPPPALDDEEEVEEGPEADDVEAATAEPATEKEAEFFSLHISEWMLSMLAMASPAPKPLGPSCSSLDLCRPDLDSRPRRLKREASERRLFLGAFLTDGSEIEEAVDWRSRSEPMPPPSGWCFWRLVSLEDKGEGCASGEPWLGSLSRAWAGRSGSGMGLAEGEVRWWMGEEGGGPTWGDKAPDGPSPFKTWWLLLINLVVTSRRRILAKGQGSAGVKLVQQILEEKKEKEKCQYR